MATLVNRDVWYDIASGGPYSSTISGYTVNWYNVIQAKWTSVSGTVYSTQYRCIIRKTGGNNTNNQSSYNGYSIGGTGASTVSATNINITYPNIGDNQVAITNGTVDVSNGTTITINGGVRLGYYGTTWGGTNLSGTADLPAVVTPKPKLYGSVNGQTKRIRKLYGPIGRLVDFSFTETDPNNLIIDFDKDIFIAKMESAHPELLIRPTIDDFSLRIRCDKTFFGLQYQLALRNSSYQTIENLTSSTAATEQYGFTLTEATSSLENKMAYIYSRSPVFAYSAKEITKLYGSVNGVAKLIYDSSQ